MARVAAADGVRVIAATPHIRADYRFDPALVTERSNEVRGALAAAGIELDVLPAGEVSLVSAIELPDATLAQLCLGDGHHLLVESPYTVATDALEHQIFDLQRRMFQPVLAHPERSPSLAGNPDRLAELVERGVTCSITAGSLAGRFGTTVRRAAIGLLRRGLVHDIASDAHDSVRRRPELAEAVAIVDGLGGTGRWYVEDAPAAILAGRARGEPPALRGRRLRRWWR